ncbi:mandelate racemase/muconate lactonizing enzyme family protein [Kribbella sandramycini]|uniref:L-alanine-DL-glutamate epimerase-like enolase superfamily enzyme n=1 Tax=Kribbella sandramycini TaxID=60450 RepID=A0A7Y4KYJ7_9ACTN|nr:mandelate racemase/muconate lactonizing enzyme family protein [Kribbella sandramycini]MBB6569123.1 L-alanine-DL-glutamate epimerase-like enolase superfamily enzyme [Kribbella sandramycini]NOL41034.1 mandelate racemase/muconate lactonizing enzyme family protein [Kribbella sandramycini]
MRIERVRCAGLRGATPAGGWSHELKPDDNVHTLISVETDEGLIGIGSVFTSEELVRGALRLLEPLYVGESALEPERVSEKLHQHTFWQGRGGAVTHTISGIDIALWDLLGQATGQPVGRLLGGRYRERVRPYASVLMTDPPSILADTLTRLRETGFTAYKIGWGPFGRVDAATDERIVWAAREAVGDDALLAVDAGGSDAYWRGDLPWAIRTSRMLAAYGVAWFEEPLDPDATDQLAALRAASAVPISGGEVLTRRQSFLPYFHAHAVDIVQPDVTKVGGLSESRRIAWAAEDHHIRFVPHGWNTAIGLLADLHLAGALPGTDLVEYMPGSPYIDDLTEGEWTLDADGMLPIPSAPGLGKALDRDVVARYADPLHLGLS